MPAGAAFHLGGKPEEGGEADHIIGYELGGIRSRGEDSVPGDWLIKPAGGRPVEQCLAWYLGGFGGDEKREDGTATRTRSGGSGIIWMVLAC